MTAPRFPVPQPEWIELLKLQQQKFLYRLQFAPDSLLRFDVRGYHSEQTTLTNEQAEKLRDRCWEMVDQVKPVSIASKDFFATCLQGLLGKGAFARRLGREVVEVLPSPEQPNPHGSDFVLTTDTSVRIQVLTQIGELSSLQWQVSAEALNANAAIVCFWLQKSINSMPGGYSLLSMGFLPTILIRQMRPAEPDETIGISLQLKDLLYSSGLWSYLQKLSGHELPVAETITAPEVLKEIWQRVLEPRQFLTTDVLLSLNGSLLALSNDEATVGLKSSTFNATPERVATLERAFERELGRSISVRLVHHTGFDR